MYKLSPSDFAYLYGDCKHCYYQKVKSSISLPSTPIPSVFSAINTRLQGNLVDKNLRALNDSLPDGIVESQEGFVQSRPIPGTQLYISGRYDLLVLLPDDTYMVVDLKISKPGDDKAGKYKMQLQAYKYAFENSATLKPIKISRMGLLMFYPDLAKFEHGKAYLEFPPTWLEVDADDDSFAKTIGEVDSLLSGVLPEPGENCQWCKYRNIMSAKADLVTSDLPF